MQLLAVRGKRQKRRFAFFCCLWSDREFVSIPRTSAREPAFSICHPERAKRVEGSLKIKKSLSFRPRRRTPMLSAFCRMAKRTTCKAAPPLPKNLAPLRFSGALFIDRVEKSCAVRIERQAPFLYSRLLLGESCHKVAKEGKMATAKPPAEKSADGF